MAFPLDRTPAAVGFGMTSPSMLNTGAQPLTGFSPQNPDIARVFGGSGFGQPQQPLALSAGIAQPDMTQTLLGLMMQLLQLVTVMMLPTAQSPQSSFAGLSSAGPGLSGQGAETPQQGGMTFSNSLGNFVNNDFKPAPPAPLNLPPLPEPPRMREQPRIEREEPQAPPAPKPSPQPKVEQSAPAAPPAAVASASAAPVNTGNSQEDVINDTLARKALEWGGRSSTHGPAGGVLACAFMVNGVLKDALGYTIGENTNYVPSVEASLRGGAGREIPMDQAKPGTIVTVTGTLKGKSVNHIGIVIRDPKDPSRLVIRSNNGKSFSWDTDLKFNGAYGNPKITYWQVTKPPANAA